jgi:phosphohistidine phosphatase SixA
MSRGQLLFSGVCIFLLLWTATLVTIFFLGWSGETYAEQTVRHKVASGMTETVPSPNSDESDIYWSRRIVDGDPLVLWFRHGEREKWTGTVTVFDFFEVNEGRDGAQENWSRAVCLTEKGRLEAQIVGRTFDVLGVNPQKVLSSPSCRARQTALEAFGRVDEEWREILHATAIPSGQQADFASILSEKLSNSVQEMTPTGPLVVTGHGGTLQFYASELFVASDVESFEMDELGFVVVESTQDGLIARHVFENFYEFANAVLLYNQ